MSLGVRLMSLGVVLEQEFGDELGGDFDEFDEFGGHFLVCLRARGAFDEFGGAFDEFGRAFATGACVFPSFFPCRHPVFVFASLPLFSFSLYLPKPPQQWVSQRRCSTWKQLTIGTLSASSQKCARSIKHACGSSLRCVRGAFTGPGAARQAVLKRRAG